MKNRKCLKIICIIVIFSIVLSMIFSKEVDAFALSDLTGNTPGTSEISDMGNKVVQIVSTIGSILSVIVIIVLGIKYMTGSVEEKAEYKKTMLPFLIGAIFIFAASRIANMVYQVAINM